MIGSLNDAAGKGGQEGRHVFEDTVGGRDETENVIGEHRQQVKGGKKTSKF